MHAQGASQILEFNSARTNHLRFWTSNVHVVWLLFALAPNGGKRVALSSRIVLAVVFSVVFFRDSVAAACAARWGLEEDAPPRRQPLGDSGRVFENSTKTVHSELFWVSTMTVHFEFCFIMFDPLLFCSAFVCVCVEV